MTLPRQAAIKDAASGLMVSRAMLIETSVQLERAKVAHAHAMADFDRYMNALASLAAQPETTGSP